ncbi:response regulator transcription factor [Candidatus Sulfurimonas marisnigri]|uniref:Response regulator transcription factor n=1 Tax=Candidatus Sulfurimonas marisnigri TaxID=2740405 RepID=A0A7S7M1G5_9BACT|nr:response regulator transcription factor [Candidatus Sulfurimonas marisnigri]QOY55299.1 response regulator transcription factor [Candidatus Sulfurimonas marisnigri]
MKVILLEDEYLLNSNIKEFLEMKGVVVEAYTDGATLLQESTFKADIAILDIEVPGATGYEVIEWINRVNNSIPTLFMTAYTDIQSIRKAYSLGCADFLKKPFDLIELWLRVQQLVDSNNYIKVQLDDNIEFDMESEQLYSSNQIKKLTKIQRKILKSLIEQKNSIVTYEVLMSDVWDGEYVKVNTIASHIKEIRRHIPDEAIESIRAEGYRLRLK